MPKNPTETFLKRLELSDLEISQQGQKSEFHVIFDASEKWEDGPVEHPGGAFDPALPPANSRKEKK